ncbi:NAD(P)-dependent oxidoreductase, partial [Kribbella turkmenica]
MKPPVLAVSRGRLPGQLVSDLEGRVELREWTSSGAPDADELAEFCADADALVCRSTDIIDDALLVRTPRLRVVARAGVGYENFDLAAMSRRSVVGCITPDVVTEATADLTWALILASCRRVVEAASWLKDPERGDALAPGFLGVDVHSKTLGVVGYGRIGRAVARRAEGFGMRVLHTGRRDDGRPGWTPLVELLTQADIVTLH